MLSRIPRVSSSVTVKCIDWLSLLFFYYPAECEGKAEEESRQLVKDVDWGRYYVSSGSLEAIPEMGILV